ncbi:PREDICTED: stimulated by retinoic acid gene 6 protein homolog [Cyprinodon variegatus]|uniref:stimulated by retinoic acid gene 6 protein homolog n=1 Tax=Cyprinodon variegatus TaxID=28743 RepID=UPI0007427B82|nr:PREDICTED: stimulated by retinoic acid gene 6 protein homolog [Cyprinodon variegatus]
MNQSKTELEPLYYYEYSDWYSDPEPTKPPREVILPCDPTADERYFHICILSISFVMMLILAALTRKNKLCQGFARGSSSIFSPANFLDQTQQKGLVMAVFGLVFSKLAMLVISPDPLPFIKDTPVSIREYMKIIAIFYYPVLYYPLLVCGTLQCSAGYVFGALLSFTHFGVLVWQKFDCAKTPEIYKYYALLASLPQLACLAFLCVQFPVLFVKGPKTDEDLDSSYYTDYVKSLLKKKSSSVSSSEADKPSLVERILEVPKSYIYLPEKVFQFPLKLAVSSFVTCVAIYQTALLLVVLVVPTLHIVHAGIDENIAFLLLGFGIVLSDDRMEVVRIVTFYTWLLEVCYLCAMTLSCLVSLVMLMRSMVLHRTNLKGLYKGDVYKKFNSQKTISPSRSGVFCWMGLTGYQAAIVCLGMAIQTLVFFICFLFLVFLIIIPIFYGRNIIVFEVAGKTWPVWVTVILVTVLQHVTAKIFFVKKDAATTDLNNRESLFLLTYLLFVANIVVGLIAAIWRMMITALYNIIHFGRIDISLLHRTAESHDPAYRYYTQFLKVEVSQSHPVLKAFCGLLLDMKVETGRAGQKIQDAEEGVQENGSNKATSSRRVCARWQLMYTLVNNPSLLGSRKHFQTLQKSESVRNGTPNRSSKKSSQAEAVKTEAEPVQSSESPSSQDKTE